MTTLNFKFKLYALSILKIAITPLIVLLSSCASDGVTSSSSQVIVASNAETELYLITASVQPHTVGGSAWEARLLVNYKNGFRANIADQYDALPLGGLPIESLYNCGVRFDCYRSGQITVVFDCNSKGSKSYLTTSVFVMSGRMLYGNQQQKTAPEVGQIRTIATGTLIEKAFNDVCNRPEVLASINRIQQSEALELERRRVEGAAAWRNAEVERERREKALNEVRARQAQSDTVEKLRKIDELLTTAEEQIKRGNDYDACESAKSALALSNGTNRLGTADSTQKRICDQHVRLTAQRKAQFDAKEANQRRLCVGTPRVNRYVIESFARSIATSPQNLSFNRFELNDYYGCQVIVYHPNGVYVCSAKLDAQGAVSSAGPCY